MRRNLVFRSNFIYGEIEDRARIVLEDLLLGKEAVKRVRSSRMAGERSQLELRYHAGYHFAWERNRRTNKRKISCRCRPCRRGRGLWLWRVLMNFERLVANDEWLTNAKPM
jgi:hypothetical protein